MSDTFLETLKASRAKLIAMRIREAELEADLALTNAKIAKKLEAFSKLNRLPQKAPMTLNERADLIDSQQPADPRAATWTTWAEQLCLEHGIELHWANAPIPTGLAFTRQHIIAARRPTCIEDVAVIAHECGHCMTAREDDRAVKVGESTCHPGNELAAWLWAKKMMQRAHLWTEHCQQRMKRSLLSYLPLCSDDERILYAVEAGVIDRAHVFHHESIGHGKKER
jgi:hypothetical protein